MLAMGTYSAKQQLRLQSMSTDVSDNQELFANSWNWVDAFLRCQLGGDEVYSMLRQAMMARCALILLDGLDEGGKNMTRIADHIVNVLVPQGHLLVVTSRPEAAMQTGYLGNAFRHLELKPLTVDQQFEVITQRVGATLKAEVLEDYIRNKLEENEDGDKFTSNPLMLSMLISIFESGSLQLKEGESSLLEVYSIAVDQMFKRLNRSKDRRGMLSANLGVVRVTGYGILGTDKFSLLLLSFIHGVL